MGDMPAETEAVSDAKEYRVIPYTAIPNGFLDNLMADCTGAEVKVVLYIARRTLGTKKGRANGSDAIALSQICDGIVKRDGTRLDRGTGLVRAAVVEALRRLEFARIIERDRGNGRTPDIWRLAAELPATKIKAPEKRFRNRTASSSKSEPLTGSENEPVAVQKSNPQKKGLNHHQKERGKKGNPGAVAEGSTAVELQTKNQNPLSSKVDDETSNPRTPFENAVEEFRARLMERHGDAVDADQLLADVRADLGDIPFSEFLEVDLKATTAPGKLMNPHGHYRGLARKLKRRGQAAELESILETRRRVQEFMSQGAPMTFVRSCSCNDGSMPDGSYCPCKIGTFRKQFDDHRRAKAAGGQQPSPLHSPAFPISVDA